MRRSIAHRQPKSALNPKPSKLWGWSKFFSFVILMCFALLVGGFLKFASLVTSAAQPSTVPIADGIVVWTGKGGGRLAAATQLLEDKKGERLLISGVNKNNSREDIIALLGISEALDSCCVDLDYAAEDTVGNARETSAWAEALGYEHIILVTSAYHMPRAKIEISNAVGQMRVTPYPVASADNGAWWKDRKQFDRYAQEYGKLLGSLLREPRAQTTDGVPLAQDNGELTPAANPAPEPRNSP